ncbi:MAG: response regulator [Terracidiphilus sp.]|jgi:CheY-like chemotaxis protein
MTQAKTKLLIVDDEHSIRTSMSQVLTAVGYQVRYAEDGLSALVEMRNEVPDILLADLIMPGMSGHELLSVVRRRFPSIQVIAMSGAFSGDEVPSGVAAHAFYQKGSSVGCLLKILSSLPRPKRKVPAQRSSATSPIWIQSGQGPGADAALTICCPECLRTFQHPVSNSISLVLEVDCLFCRSHIYYALVKPAPRQPIQILQQTRGEELPSPSAQPQFYY